MSNKCIHAHTASDSPAKLAGYAAGITDDFELTARNMTTPTIGAYE